MGISLKTKHTAKKAISKIRPKHIACQVKQQRRTAIGRKLDDVAKDNQIHQRCEKRE